MQAQAQTTALQEMTPSESAMVARVTARSRGLGVGPEGSAKPPKSEILREAIHDLEAAIQENPDEWIFLHKACELYISTKQYDKAVELGERALLLAAQDPRSYYALAVAYLMLTPAKYATPAYAARVEATQAKATSGGFDPEASLKALESLRMSVEQVGGRSRELFAKLLQFDIKPDEREFVQELCLKPLEKDFGPRAIPVERTMQGWWKYALGAALALVLLWVGLDRFGAATQTRSAADPSVAGASSDQSKPGAVGNVSAPSPVAATSSKPAGSNPAAAKPAKPADGVPATPEPAPVANAPGVPPVAAPAPAAALTAPGPAILLADYFDQPAAGKLARSASDPGHYRSGYLDGEYLIETIDPGWGQDPFEYIPGRFADASVALDVRITGEADGRYVEVMCRVQDDPTSHYRLMLLPAEQSFSLLRSDAGQVVQLAPLQKSDAIQTDGRAKNNLELSCARDQITARINAREVASVRDSAYEIGQMALGAGSLKEGDATVNARFDNLIVTQQ